MRAGGCWAINRKNEYLLYDVGLRPASTLSGIPIYHVEQAGLFPTTYSLQSQLCPVYFDIQHTYWRAPVLAMRLIYSLVRRVAICNLDRLQR